MQLAGNGGAPAPRRFQSNLTRRTLPFLGRDHLLARMAEILGDPQTDNVVILHGPAGVGKSELAREFGRRYSGNYPGGTFVVDGGAATVAIDLATIGRTSLGIDFPPDLLLPDQALRTFYTLGQLPSLLILDNVQSEEAVRPWLPPAGMPCHVVMTTLLDRWDVSWLAIPVDPLPDEVSFQLVDQLAGAEAAGRHREQLVKHAGGLPVQLVSQSLTLANATRRGRADTFVGTVSQETMRSFRGVYDLIGPPARLLLHAAARLNTQRIVARELALQLAEGAGWSEAEFAQHLDACLDLHVLDGADELRMHQLFAAFARETAPASEFAELFARVVRAQARRMVEIAVQVAATPNRSDLASALMSYPVDHDVWKEFDTALSGEDSAHVGWALIEIGQFAAARPWFERAIAAAEKDDVHGRVDPADLGSRLHNVGYCLWSAGDFGAARPWFERAIAEMEKSDVHGRVDHERLGRSMQLVGHCLLNSGDFAAARSWFERAVAEAEKGDVYGRVNHDTLGRSLHHVGYCLASSDAFTAARPWFERAVAETEKGDAHGRVDHEGLGSNLHLVGYCLSRSGNFTAARPWFERAVTEAEKGDVHGRVDHESLSKSLHYVGYCLSRSKKFTAARPWFERAVAEAEKGDVHGRVDHHSVGASMHDVGYCLSRGGEVAAARFWFERAVAAKEKGDLYGRVNQESLERSRRVLRGES